MGQDLSVFMAMWGMDGDGANLDPLKLKDAYFEQKPRSEQPLDHRQPMTLTAALLGIVVDRQARAK